MRHYFWLKSYLFCFMSKVKWKTPFVAIIHLKGHNEGQLHQFHVRLNDYK